ncbi:hypothetical protein TNCT_364671 [Trichonephila clavata]|uniref:Uncharacterized protein n=1 Tax=Trichonephila clavata TaxID=2740835 RepID=A0A8X6JEF4_TRICU|nr:hypothetical protein TNCT_364671 [Trichonephila clavata]
MVCARLQRRRFYKNVFTHSQPFQTQHHATQQSTCFSLEHRQNPPWFSRHTEHVDRSLAEDLNISPPRQDAHILCPSPLAVLTASNLATMRARSSHVTALDSLLSKG